MFTFESLNYEKFKISKGKKIDLGVIERYLPI